MATPEPSRTKARTGLGRLANAPTPSRAIMAVNAVLVCVICDTTSKSQHPGQPGQGLLAFPRKIACQYCLWYYMNMHSHIEWPIYSAAFTGSDGSLANSALVGEVKADLEEMYNEVKSGKMKIPDLDRSIDFSNAESPRRV